MLTWTTPDDRFLVLLLIHRFQAFAAIFRWVSGATVVEMSETPASINIIFVFFLSAGVFIIHLDIARENHRRSSSSASS